MKNLKTLVSAILSVLADFIEWAIVGLFTASKWLKKWFNIETCVYRYWWKLHSKKMQRALDRAHGTDYASRM